MCSVDKTEMKGIEMYGYMLVTVEEREISAEQFDSFDKAREKMITELKEEYARCYGSEKDFNNIDLSEIYYYYERDEQGDYIFAIGCDWAWSNINNDWCMDWRIVPIK